MAAMPLSMTPLMFVLAVITLAGCTAQAATLDHSVHLQLYAQRSPSQIDDLRQGDPAAMQKVADILSEDVLELEQLLHTQEMSPTASRTSPLDLRFTAHRESSPIAGLQIGRTEACPMGYLFAPGDVPGGDFFGRGFDNVMDSISSCAADCNGRDLCLSFEYSPTSKNCYLNKEGKPSASLLGDTVFCTKKVAPSFAAKPASNATAGNATVASAPETKAEGWMTFHGRFNKIVGMVLWSLIGLVLFFLLCSVCWCCCCGLMMFFSGGDVETLDNDSDKELHEVWVRSGKK